MVWRNIQPAYSLFCFENGGITVTEIFVYQIYVITVVK
jgi:short subunit fatty acids transporter